VGLRGWHARSDGAVGMADSGWHRPAEPYVLGSVACAGVRVLSCESKCDFARRTESVAALQFVHLCHRLPAWHAMVCDMCSCCMLLSLCLRSSQRSTSPCRLSSACKPAATKLMPLAALVTMVTLCCGVNTAHSLLTAASTRGAWAVLILLRPRDPEAGARQQKSRGGGLVIAGAGRCGSAVSATRAARRCP
jgi:hypothetical protein